MAYDIDNSFKIPLSRKVFFRYGGVKFIKKFRHIQKKLKSITSSEIDLEKIANANIFVADWDSVGEHYEKHRWAFVNPFLKEDIHKEIKDNWPQKMFFSPPRKMTKWYDTGFNWDVQNLSHPSSIGHPVYLSSYPSLAVLFASLSTDAFEASLSKLAGVQLRFSEFHLTHSGAGAEVPVHLDSLAKDSTTKGTLGLAIFIAGTGGKEGGGLAVLKSNSWNDVIFEPETLNNTVLIYDKRHYHGFRPIKKGKYRLSINTQFRTRLI